MSVTRVNNARSGVVSGIDVPLPPNCATATCHHREHQLTRKAELALESYVYDRDTDVVYSTGWATPSDFYIRRSRMHNVVSKRQWWKFWQPRNETWPEICTDLECQLDHWEIQPLAQTMLDLPQISVRRGGIRHEAGKGGSA